MKIACARWRKYMASFVALTLLLIVGCGGQDSAPKMSLYEDDHAVAEHWPSDLADVAVKVRERLSDSDADTDANSNAFAEIEDLVSWTAEVAADTDLAESDWLSLYEASESLMANLRSAKGVLTPANKTQLESLCSLIEVAASKVPEQLPSLV